MATFADIYNAGDFDLSGLQETKPLAQVLGGDDESAEAVMRLVEGVEHYNAYVRHPEGMLLPTLSLEALDGEKKAGLIAQIIEWLRRLMKTLFDEMTGLEQMARWVNVRAGLVKENSRNRTSNYASGGNSFTMTTHITNLCVRSKPVENSVELLTHLRTLSMVVTAFYQYQPLARLSDVMHAVQASRDPAGLQAILAPLSPQQLINTKAFFDHPEVDGWYASPHLLGSHRLVIKQRHGDDEAKRLMSTVVRLLPSDTTMRPLPEEINFLRFNVGQSDQILTLVESLSSLLLKVNTLNNRTQRSNALDQLSRALKKLDVDSTMSASEPDTVNQIGLTAALVEHYIDWIANPYNGLYGLTCRNLRAALKVCELNNQ